MALQIRKATRRKAKLRLALLGPSGSGKTMSAIKLAAGIGGKIGVIDTENGSADLYAELDMEAARQHWTSTRQGTALGDESLDILDFFDAAIKRQGGAA